MIDIIKRNKVRFFIIVIVLGYLLLGAGDSLIRMYLYQGEWGRFDSQDHVQAETFPDGFRLEYPTSWGVSTFEKGGTKNAGELRVRFIKPNYFIWPNTYLHIWWRRVDASWTLDDAREWFVEDLSFGIRDTELEQKRDSFEEITVGMGNHPALFQTFEEFGGKNPQEQVIILVVGDEAFVFTFFTNNYDEDTQKAFERMLKSLEIYK